MKKKKSRRTGFLISNSTATTRSNHTCYAYTTHSGLANRKKNLHTAVFLNSDSHPPLTCSHHYLLSLILSVRFEPAVRTVAFFAPVCVSVQSGPMSGLITRAFGLVTLMWLINRARWVNIQVNTYSSVYICVQAGERKPREWLAFLSRVCL